MSGNNFEKKDISKKRLYYVMSKRAGQSNQFAKTLE